MKPAYNTAYPAIDDLRGKARRNIPRFAFEYLDGGCNEDVNLAKNTAELRQVELKPYYLRDYTPPNMATTIFGHTYDAPFGIAPVGLQGLIWPGSPEILARSAFEQNIPFILSTVTTASIEKISEVTEGSAWYQLYHPADPVIRDKIIDRLSAANYPVLVLLCDVPSFGFRPKDIRNGLAMPPRMTLRNMMQIMGKPGWALRTLYHGQPRFETMLPYMPKGLNMKQLGLFMNQTFSGRLNEERIKPIRDRFKGRIILKGVATEEDAAMALQLGLDGVIVSNHGGRQLDAGQSAIATLPNIAEKFGSKMEVMMDSGVRSGPDIARTIASGASMAFLGRTFMYSVAALGKEGGDHAIAMLKTQLRQVMDQLCCARPVDLKKHLCSTGASL